MRARGQSFSLLCVTLAILCFPPGGFAQQASGIAGQVKDASGAVLPGVTVEASSPALIEKVRVVVTDGSGQYNIVGLGPGTYAVSFNLPGFSTLKREGIILTAGFTATVNAEMRVGSVEETITVTGAAPLVDSANVRQAKIISNELLATLPTSSKALQTLITIIPGFAGAADVGGASGIYRSNSPRLNTFHGKGSAKQTYDSMNVQNLGAAGATAYVMNPSTAEETVVETGGVSAESSASGFIINLVPREGGNKYRADISAMYTNEHLQSNNLNDELIAAGITVPNTALYIYDVNPTIGGPLKQDRMWFFTAARFGGNKNIVPGVYHNSTQGTPFYTPDLSNPSTRREQLESLGGRLTWQASAKNKINAFVDVQSLDFIGRGDFVAQEAQNGFLFWPNTLGQVTWTSPKTNRVLLEAGVSWMHSTFVGQKHPSVTDRDISILEQSTGFRYNARNEHNRYKDDRGVQRVSASYVTGTHAYKAGITVEEGLQSLLNVRNGDSEINYTFLNRRPVSLMEFATPYTTEARMLPNVMIFAQDQWSLRRLTLNYGVRFDWLKGSVPAQHVAAARFVPFERDFPAVDNVPNWKDVNPRFGVAYDLFGNGRTALKSSIGRYVGLTGVNIAVQNNALNTAVNAVTRTWNDSNQNYTPDCDLTTPTANGECGAINDSNFGRPNPRVTRWAEDALLGWGTRDYLWDFAAEVQHEIVQGVSITGGYYRNWSNRFSIGAGGNDAFVTDNLAVTPADFDPYCITAPSDPRLPGGGGYQVCGLYDVKPALFGRVQNLVTQASNYGNGAHQTNNFFGLGVTTRLQSGVQLGGGVDTGRTVIDKCFVVDSPAQEIYDFTNPATPTYCRVVRPFGAQTQLKMYGTYPLPGRFFVSGTLQNLAGPTYLATYTATNAEIAPSLGRNLAACGTQAVCTATAPVPLVAPNTLYKPRRTQLDLRVSKTFPMRAGAQVQANLDVYNVFNSSALLNLNETYGPRWQLPVGAAATGNEAMLWGRLVQVSGRFTF